MHPGDERENSEVADNEDHSGVLVLGLSIVLAVVPADCNSLHSSHAEDSVNVEVVVESVEESLTPVETEESSSSSTNHAESSCDAHLGPFLANPGVLNHNDSAFNHGESRVDTQSEQGQEEEQAPKVGSGHSVDSGGESNEGETSGGQFVGHGGGKSNEVSNNGEDGEASEEGETAVDGSDSNRVPDDG